MDDYLNNQGESNIKTSVAEYLLGKLENSKSNTTTEEKRNKVFDRVVK